MLQNYTNVIK